MICDLTNIKDVVKREGLEVLVVSYGGSCSNALVQQLHKNRYKCTSQTWHKILCHCPHYIDVDIPIIYVYDHPIKSFMSMKKRGQGYWDANQKKMSNHSRIPLSDDNLIQLMINQFHSWTSVKRDNVLIVKTTELFEDAIVGKLETFLKKKLKHFPIPYKTPKTDAKKVGNNQLIQLFIKYKSQIDKIIDFPA